MTIKGNAVGAIQPRPNYNQTDPSKPDYLDGKDELDAKIAAAKKAGDNAAVAAGKALQKTGGTMTGVLNMGNHRITGLPEPTQDSDIVTKKYMETYAAGYIRDTLLGGEW